MNIFEEWSSGGSGIQKNSYCMTNYEVEKTITCVQSGLCSGETCMNPKVISTLYQSPMYFMSSSGCGDIHPGDLIGYTYQTIIPGSY